jgi:hypothetical protein
MKPLQTLAWQELHLTAEQFPHRHRTAITIDFISISRNKQKSIEHQQRIWSWNSGVFLKHSHLFASDWGLHSNPLWYIHWFLLVELHHFKNKKKQKQCLQWKPIKVDSENKKAIINPNLRSQPTNWPYPLKIVLAKFNSWVALLSSNITIDEAPTLHISSASRAGVQTN